MPSFDPRLVSDQFQFVPEYSGVGSSEGTRSEIMGDLNVLAYNIRQLAQPLIDSGRLRQIDTGNYRMYSTADQPKYPDGYDLGQATAVPYEGPSYFVSTVPSPFQYEVIEPEKLETIESIPAKEIEVDKMHGFLNAPPMGRVPSPGRGAVQVGATDQSRRGSRTGQRLEREYYWDPKARQYKERIIDEERRGGPVYGGSYSFDRGGKVKTSPLVFGSYPQEDVLDVNLLKKGIRAAESLNGLLMINPNSSATGLYGQLYGEIKDMPFMKGISRQDFADSLDLQEEVFNMRLEDGFDAPSLRRNAAELTEEYEGQLGDDWNYSLNDVAALSNYLGRQGAREYFASIRDNTIYEPPGVNMDPVKYLKKFRDGMAAE